jgi:hypothetical protein
VTDKRVQRTLDLAGLPEDGFPLAVAASADELLRASWAELVLNDAPARAVPVPEPVERALAPTLHEFLRSRELSAAAGYTLGRFRAASGMRLRFGYWLADHLSIAAAIEASFGRKERAPHGTVRADATAVELMLGYTPWSCRNIWGLMLEVGVSLERLTFAAHAKPNAEANSFVDFSALGHARVRGWLGQDWLRGTLALGAGYGIKPARAYDSGRVVTSNEGFRLEAELGVGIFF